MGVWANKRTDRYSDVVLTSSTLRAEKTIESELRKTVKEINRCTNELNAQPQLGQRFLGRGIGICRARKDERAERATMRGIGISPRATAATISECQLSEWRRGQYDIAVAVGPS